MSYDLAVWEGPRPESDAVAAVEFARRVSEMDRLYDAGQPMTEPSAAIREFVATVEGRYPDDEDDPGGSPWAVFPLIGNAVGDGIFIPMTYPGARSARDVVAEIATSQGLVCFDPQEEALLR